MLRILSFSLWGADGKYRAGAIRNANLAREVYPEWTTRFYVHQDVAATVKTELSLAGAQVVAMARPADWTGLLWRYLVIEDPAVTLALFRDCDSRLGPRERAAVDEWLATNRTLHVMRDHPYHRFPIMGGLWGVRCERVRWIPRLFSSPAADAYNVDQELLAREVWPRLREDAVVHDDFRGPRRFPTRRCADEFVGQVYDAQDVPHALHAQTLRAYLEQGPHGAPLPPLILSHDHDGGRPLEDAPR